MLLSVARAFSIFLRTITSAWLCSVCVCVLRIHAHILCSVSVLQSAIRVGDVFAVLVEFYYMQRNMEQAFRLIENMRQRGIVLAPFLDADLINTVYRYYNEALFAFVVTLLLFDLARYEVCSSMWLFASANVIFHSPLPSLLSFLPCKHLPLDPVRLSHSHPSVNTLCHFVFWVLPRTAFIKSYCFAL